MVGARERLPSVSSSKRDPGSGPVLVVASGLRDIGGHNYTYTRLLETALSARGVETAVLAHAGLADSLRACGYRAVFSKGTYDFPYGRGPLHSLLKLWRQAGVYATELAAAIAATRPVPRGIFCHTLSDFELVGWSRFARRSRSQTPIVLMLRETPDFFSMSFYRRWLHPFTGLRPRALRSMDRRCRGRFVLATDTDLLAADYATVFDGTIRSFPIPVGPGVPEGPRDEKTGVVIGYVGDCRGAKGFHRLAPMIREVLARTPASACRFVVQLYKGSYASPETPPGWDDIESLAATHSERVTLVRGVLDDDAYSRLFASIDVLLIPNDHPAFRTGSSNVYSEAAASGKAVIVGTGTWMAAQLSRYQGGAAFSLTEAADFPRAVQEVVGNWPTVRERARGFGTLWRGEHSPDRLAAAVLDAFREPGLGSGP